MTTETILTILTAVLGGGWITQILKMRYEKRKWRSEAKSAEIDVDKKEDEIRDKKLIDSYDTNMKLQDLLNKERDARIELIQENTCLKLELADKNEKLLLAEFAKCTRDGCMDRIPPRIADVGKFHYESAKIKQ